MKLFLNLLEMEIPSIESLALDDKKRLLKLWSQLSKLSVTQGVRFFGAGDKLHLVDGADQLAKEFRKRKPGTYSFSDVKDLINQEAQVDWSIGIRKAYLTVKAECESSAEHISSLSRELVVLNQILVSTVMEGKVATPFSFLRTPGVQFKLTRPPRSLGTLAIDSIVDIIYLTASCGPEDQEIIDLFKSKDLPTGVRRSSVDNFLVVEWGDVTERSVSSILSERYRWLIEEGKFAIDSTFNSIGDKEFALWEPIPTREFTGYSAFNGKATKAVVFDEPEEIVELLEQLRKILVAGKTSKGNPVNEITLIVPSRESALSLHPLATRYGMPVVYVGDDNRLWNPFPPEYENA